MEMMLAVAQDLLRKIDVGGIVIDQQDFSFGFPGSDRKISVPC